jgi:hypothetical protein
MSPNRPPSLLKAEDLDLLRTTILRRQPDLISLVDSLGQQPLTDDQRELLRDVLLKEFLEVGLEPNDEPNKLGIKLDDLIGLLGRF